MKKLFLLLTCLFLLATPCYAIKIAAIKGDPGTNGTNGTIISTCKTTADINQTTTTLANITNLNFNVVSGSYYQYEFFILFQSSIATNGLKLAVTYPAATVASYRAEIPIAADAAAGDWHGWGTSSGDAITGTGVQTANVVYMAKIVGNILPSANGTIQSQYASEVATNTTTIKQGSFGRLIQY